jgi:uncharacterized protein
LSNQHRITLAGIELLPDHSGALFAPEFKTLLVSDLHLEHGASLARRGIHVPPFDTTATLAALEGVIAETKPWRMVLMGDSFHDRIAHLVLEEAHRNRLLQITSNIETIWITGNHDPDPPNGLGGFAVAAHKLGPVVLRHEPSLETTFEIAGHLHPGATIIQRGIATRAKCFIADTRRVIMPAFGAYTGALNVRSRAFDGLFQAEDTHVWMIGKSAIHKFPLARAS